MKAFCLFEQSGTFKRAFIRHGVPAFDFDLRNAFGETDRSEDLFEEIRRGYDDKPSIFDELDPGDWCMAFFPCIRFCEASQLNMRYSSYPSTDVRRKTEIIMRLSRERADYFELLAKLFCLAAERGFRLVVENPYSPPGFLRLNKPLFPPRLFDENRWLHGDYFVKPTAYWMVGVDEIGELRLCPRKEPPLKVFEQKGSDRRGLCSRDRSMISPEYAENFVRNVLLNPTRDPMQGRLPGF